MKFLTASSTVRLPDSFIAEIADAEDRIVVTKDADFRHSHLTVIRLR